MKPKIKFSDNHIKLGIKKRYIAIVVFCIIICISSILLNNKYNTENKVVNDNTHNEKIVTQSEIEKDLDNQIKKAELEKSTRQINEINIKVHDILGEEEQHYGIYYYDINTECRYYLNSNKEFKAASTMKVPIAMMIADKLSSGELKENTLIEYISDDDSDGAGVLQGTIFEGDKIEVLKLMQYMIEESDNVATSMLKRNVGNIREYITNLTSIGIDSENNFITPDQSYMILKKLYNESSTNIYYRKIIEFMKQTSTHDRLDKYILNNLVAHKIGDYGSYVNDVGIIYTEEPYILVIYTENEMEKGRENIAQISKVIYEIKTNN